MNKENTPTLETERLILRKFKPSDLDDVFMLYSDKDVNTFLPWFPLRTIDEARDYLFNTILPQYAREVTYSYAIELKETGKVIGYVHVHDIGDANDIGYAVAKQYWNKGIVGEACRKVIERLKSAGYQYVTATHDINNPASGRVMIKIGMTYKYSYEELWEPKNKLVTFRMYQVNLDGRENRLYSKYWDKCPNHCIEKL